PKSSSQIDDRFTPGKWAGLLRLPGQSQGGLGEIRFAIAVDHSRAQRRQQTVRRHPPRIGRHRSTPQTGPAPTVPTRAPPCRDVPPSTLTIAPPALRESRPPCTTDRGLTTCWLVVAPVTPRWRA